MKFKRLGAGILAAALSATSVGIYAYAEEDAAMKQELTYVKQRLDIPEELTNFEHRSSTSQGKTRYTFTWRTGDDAKKPGMMTVAITGKVINSISISYSDDEDADDSVWGSSFAKLSDEKLLAAAKKYLKQINPTIYENIEINDDINISLWGNEAYLSFKRVQNGVPVASQTGSISINKNTGALIRYSNNWINGATFSDKKNAISLADAQKAYKKLFPVEKVYTLEYDWENDKYIPHLIYRQTAYGQINAFTGELSKFEDYRSYGDADTVSNEEAMMADSEDDSADGGAAKEVTFSEAEIEKLEKENSLIKADKALSDLQKLGIFYIPKESEVDSQYCYFDERSESYIRNVSFRGKTDRYTDLNGGIIVPVDGYNKVSNPDYSFYGNFSINAESGELLYFYCSSPDVGKNLDQKTYDKKADAAVSKLLGDSKSHFGKIECTYASKNYTKYDPNTGAPVGEPRIVSLSYGASRVEYGITCVNESVSLQIGNVGYVTSFNVNFHKDVDYPKPEKIISKGKAYNQFFKQVDLGLLYRCAYNNDEKKVVSALVYSADSSLYIDAFTGKLTSSNGREIISGQKAGDYTDLENSKYKDIAEKLKRYGITLMDNNGRLNENDTITVYDFANVMSSAGISVNAREKDMNSIKEDTKVTRQLAAYLLVSGRYGNEVADMTSVFKSKFSDVKDGSKYVGYIMIADASGLLKGNGTKYSPKAALTRGATLKLIYDYLSK